MAFWAGQVRGQLWDCLYGACNASLAQIRAALVLLPGWQGASAVRIQVQAGGSSSALGCRLAETLTRPGKHTLVLLIPC